VKPLPRSPFKVKTFTCWNSALPVRRRALACSLVATAALVAGCGERPEPLEDLPAEYPVVVRGAGDRPTVATKAPERIVALDAGSAELIAALGVGERLLGVPAGVEDTTATQVVSAVGRVNVDAVVKLDPDLVVGTPSTDPLDLARAARESGGVSYVQPAESVAEVERGALELGFLLDRAPEARRLVARIRRGVAEIEARIAGLTVVPVFVDTGFLITVSDRSLQGDLVRLAQGRSVAGPNPGPEPFEPCDVVRLDVRVVLAVSNRNERTPAEEFTSCPDGRRVRIAAVPPDLVLRAGPRIPEALEAVARALHPNAFR
jgi:ABC-type Fe3+-hydroxamate transport system substrate-binding protein